MIYYVLGLDSIFNEVLVSHGVVCNVVLNPQMMHAMNCDSAVERVVYAVVADVRIIDCPDHVEVYRISSEPEGLSSILHLNVLQPPSQRFVAFAVKHYCHTIHCWRSRTVAAVTN